MDTLFCTVPQAEVRYPVLIGNHLFADWKKHFDFSAYHSVLIFIDEVLEDTWAPFLHHALAEYPHILHPMAIKEGEKDVATLESLWSFFQEQHVDKHTLVIIFGGGVMGDVLGFALATYLRGIPYLFVPTTFLAQADSSVGGKVGVNYGGVKNALGTFHQPIGVVLDACFLTDLPRRQYVSGLAEVIKHGIIDDSALFTFLEEHGDGTFTKEEEVFLLRTLHERKLASLAQDPYEEGARLFFHFGHTLGHALEAYSFTTTHSLLHGEAVALGMRYGCQLSVALGYQTKAEATRVDALLRGYGLPLALPFSCTWEDIYPLMQHDKKVKEGIPRFVLPSGIGNGRGPESLSVELLEQTFATLFSSTR